MPSQRSDAPASATRAEHKAAGESAPTLTTGLKPLSVCTGRSPGHMMAQACDKTYAPPGRTLGGA